MPNREDATPGAIQNALRLICGFGILPIFCPYITLGKIKKDLKINDRSFFGAITVVYLVSMEIFFKSIFQFLATFWNEITTILTTSDLKRGKVGVVMFFV